MTTATPRRPEDHGTAQEAEHVDPAGSVLTPASTELVSDDLEVPGPTPVLDDAEPAAAQTNPVTGGAPTSASPDPAPEVLIAPAARAGAPTPSAQTPPEAAVEQEAQSAPGRRAARHAATQDDPSTTAVRRRSLFAREEEAHREAAEQAEAAQPSEASTAPGEPTSVTSPAEAAASAQDEDDDAPMTPVWPRRTLSRAARRISSWTARWSSGGRPHALRPTGPGCCSPSSCCRRPGSSSTTPPPTSWGPPRPTALPSPRAGSSSSSWAVSLLVLALWTARRSSLGTFVVGAITLVAGLPGLVAPGPVDAALSPFLTRLAEQSTLGKDVATMIWSDAVSGRFLAVGLALVMVGVASHSARRAGRREQEVIDRVRHVG